MYAGLSVAELGGDGHIPQSVGKLSIFKWMYGGATARIVNRKMSDRTKKEYSFYLVVQMRRFCFDNIWEKCNLLSLSGYDIVRRAL